MNENAAHLNAILELVETTRANFADVADRVIGLSRLTTALNEFIGQAELCNRYPGDAGMVLTMMSMALRTQGAAALTSQFFEAIAFSIECLRMDAVLKQDVEECGRHWDLAGVDCVPAIIEYIAILEEEREELAAGDDDEDSVP